MFSLKTNSQRFNGIRLVPNVTQQQSVVGLGSEPAVMAEGKEVQYTKAN